MTAPVKQKPALHNETSDSPALHKPLSVILDEIQRSWEEDDEVDSAQHVLALVKALRRAMPAIEQHGYLMRDITAILNQKQQDHGN